MKEEAARKAESRRKKSTSQKTRKRTGTASWFQRDTPSATSRDTSSTCRDTVGFSGAAPHLGPQVDGKDVVEGSGRVRGQTSSKGAQHGTPHPTAPRPADLCQLTAGGGCQLEGDEEVGAEDEEHLEGGDSDGEGVEEGQEVQGEAAESGQRWQRRGTKKPWLLAAHQPRAQGTQAELAWGDRGTPVSPSQIPRSQYSRLTSATGEGDRGHLMEWNHRTVRVGKAP